MQFGEHFLSRLEIQPDWLLEGLSRRELVICDTGSDMLRTLALASACSGFKHLCLVGEDKQRLYTIADEVMAHTGFESGIYMQVMTPNAGRVKYSARSSAVYIIDAGYPVNDRFGPSRPGRACYFALGQGEDGSDTIAFGTNRRKVAQGRRRISMVSRAEIPAVCAHLIVGAIKLAGGCDAVEPLAPVARMPLPELPAVVFPKEADRYHIIYAGGGGAIANQHLYAESLDPVLRRFNRKSRVTVVDPKKIHISCVNRQWLYPMEALHGDKSEWAARWVDETFPGVQVTGIPSKIGPDHFSNGCSEAHSSVDSWQARKVIAELCGETIPWYSTGSSFFGGFARRIDFSVPRCRSAFEGVERLAERPDDEATDSSCSGEQVPLPSSVLPQMILGSYTCCLRRASVLGTLDGTEAARGIEVHLTHASRVKGYEGLRWSPGRRLNLK